MAPGRGAALHRQWPPRGRVGRGPQPLVVVGKFAGARPAWNVRGAALPQVA